MFTGFEKECFVFLQNLQQHNSKEWFEEHRRVYEGKLLTPFRSLVEALSEPMQQIDKYIETRPAIGKTISQVRRDTRFSHDKSLYRNNIWLTFKRPKKNWTDAPAYFFEFGPDWWHYGLGYYSASPATMGLFRDRLLQFPHEFQEATDAIPKGFLVHAESYKRQAIPETLPPELTPWYVRKSFYIASRSTNMTPLSLPDLPLRLLKGFKQLSQMYRFLVAIEDAKQEQKQLNPVVAYERDAFDR